MWTHELAKLRLQVRQEDVQLMKERSAKRDFFLSDCGGSLNLEAILVAQSKPPFKKKHKGNYKYHM